jgi:hypothetical protein
MNPRGGGIPMKKFRREIAPPLFLRWVWRKIHPYGFFGDYATWEEARKRSTGYDSDQILEKKTMCHDGIGIYPRGETNNNWR